jgi:hypothetical protein
VKSKRAFWLTMMCSFAVPTSKFCAYQTGKAAPWFFKRWVLFQKGAKLEPLYDMDRTLENSGDKA